MPSLMAAAWPSSAWLRHPASRDEASTGTTLLPVLRLKHLLNVLERNPEHARAFAGVLNSIWRVAMSR